MRTKFCGITRLDDAEHAARVGAWAIGLNHWPGSPRRCEPDAAAEIGAAMHRRLEVVGVFVNAHLDEIARAVEAEHLSLVQLHGDEGLAFCLEVARRTGCRVIKALRVASGADLDRARSFRTDFHLLDAHRPGVPGGTGESFDWEILRGRRSRVPLILAGGLRPENVAEAIATTRTWAVDVASGVETAPGIKDHNLMSEFQRRADEQGGPTRPKPVSEPDHFRESRERDAEERARARAEAARAAAESAERERREAPAAAAWVAARGDAAFRAELDLLLRDYVGRPTPLYLAERLSERTGRRVYLKREDLAHTGSHKINNAVGQALLAKRMGKPRVIAETGAGQHGVASATACALLGLECVVYMGSEDMRRQAPNVERMRLLGARVEPVEAGARTLKEAVSAAIRDWVTNVADTHYIIGSAVGPAPYPALVRDLQRVIGVEAREQALAAEGALPARVIACVGGGSNAIGTFAGFIEDHGVELIGVEAAGEGLDTARHGASLVAGTQGVLHGAFSSVLADADGQILEAHSVSAGLDYPGVGPEHAWLRDSGRARYVAVTDTDALLAFRELARLEGIVPALEPAHAIAWLMQEADARGGETEPDSNPDGPGREAESSLANPDGPGREAEEPSGFDLLTLSGRGDKDLAEVTERLDELGE